MRLNMREMREKKKPAGRNVAGKGDSDDRSIGPLRGARTCAVRRRKGVSAGVSASYDRARRAHSFRQRLQGRALRRLVVGLQRRHGLFGAVGLPELRELGSERIHLGLSEEAPWRVADDSSKAMHVPCRPLPARRDGTTEGKRRDSLGMPADGHRPPPARNVASGRQLS